MLKWPAPTFRVLVTCLLALGAIALQPGHGQAQSVTTKITSSGLNTVFTTPTGIPLPPNTGCTASCNITGGSRPLKGLEPGPNLFHSFGLFTVGTNDTAKFVNTSGAGVQNIIGWVTGDPVTGPQVSDIFGAIAVDAATFPRTSLLLLHSDGVVFGPNAKLSVPGSVHVSTGNYVGLADGKRFSIDTTDTTLLSANPVSFGFLTGRPPASIIVSGSSPQQQLSVA